MAYRETLPRRGIPRRQMMKRVARFSKLKGFDGGLPDSRMPGCERILYNVIRDLQRRHGVQRRYFGWLPGGSRHDDEAGEDPLEQVPDAAPEPLQQLAADEAMQHLDRALRRLPPRQFEAFTLRCLEGLDVATTAAAMGCSEGSVKTHYFRALQVLRAELAEVRT